MLTLKEVAKHNSRDSCWVIIERRAYDLTDFLDDHPGGSGVILRYGGKDATIEYMPIHPAGTLDKHLSKDKHLGEVDMPPPSAHLEQVPPSPVDMEQPADIPLELCQNLFDMEVQASKHLSERAFTYFHSAADSLQSLEANRRDWTKVTFRPRVLRDVTRADMSRKIMGQPSTLPIFISPMAMIKLADGEGEVALARAAGRKGIPYIISTYASCSYEEIMQCVNNEGLPRSQFFQLYVPRKRERAIELIKIARQLGFGALLVTVDTPVVGRREEDERYKARVNYLSGHTGMPRSRDIPDTYDKPVLRGSHSSTLNWNDLRWIKEAWEGAGPIILKGIQTSEDALLAYQHNVHGIYLSNHGGRQLDFAPSSLQTLVEIHRFCPQIIGKIDIYLDGGVRRGTDVLKAICLGATAVGLGRPFVYALGAYGRKGVKRAIELLSDEIETTMRLLGVTSLDELTVHHVNSRELEQAIVKESSFADSNAQVKARL